MCDGCSTLSQVVNNSNESENWNPFAELIAEISAKSFTNHQWKVFIIWEKGGKN